jgi:CBS domain-containing protein
MGFHLVRDRRIIKPGCNRERRDAMTIAAILESKGNSVTSVPPGTRVADLVTLLAEQRIGAVPVVEGDRVLGIISERDILYGLARDGAAVLEQTVEAVMTSPPVTVARDVPVLSALAQMTRRRIRHLPVVEGDALIGFVSIGDLVKLRVDRIEAEAAAMRDYIQSV